MKGTGTHCCLISNQLMPNIIPLLDLKTRPKHLELLVTEDRHPAYRQMLRLCRELGISVRQHPVTPWNIDNIQDTVRNLLREYAGLPISLNVTGGTKLMALWAYYAFSAEGREVFYIDTHNDRRIHLSPETSQEALPNVLNIRNCLTAHGYSLGAHSKGYVKREQHPLTEQLITQVKNIGCPFCLLNWYAQEALAELRIELSPAHLRDSDFLELLQHFKAAGCLDWDDSRSVLRFPNEDSRFYVNGGWFQQYVLSVLNNLRPAVEIGDLAANAFVQAPDNRSNEIDVMFTARNRLFLIECKTKNLSPDTLASSEAINKLKTLTPKLGGAYGKAMCVSILPLKKNHANRCKQYDIELVQGDEINNLQFRLKHWIESA